ncbi:GTPase [Burkholderia pyrrocinia]|uniref:phosphorylase family protein n=1 Tax=Burkholderia pyrrocinia TaxID=60550 RepID=UPI001588764F|nr:GTPase [Burkholderia pyrrocinia]
MNANALPDTLASTLTRHTDIAPEVVPRTSPSLPPVDWRKIGQSAPVRIASGARTPYDPLPRADIVILTWTSAEWFALDHVFVNSDTVGDASQYGWRDGWLPYCRGASGYSADTQAGTLWGLFQMVRIVDRSGRPWNVLLFKSNAHLAHSPWLDGLAAMVRCIVEDARPDRIYTIGTAGGARTDQRLGDTVVANATLLELQRPQNTASPDDGNMARCPTWYPSTALLGDVERELLFRMDQVVTQQSLQSLFDQLKALHPNDPGLSELTLDDLLNDALRPACLNAPAVLPLKDTPLLTTDFYYIAEGRRADAYACLEMDDAIIAQEANRLGVRFACVRNISDPVVPKHTRHGRTIADATRADWSGLIYTTFGMLTSYNGALATWATIAGEGSAVYNPSRDHVPHDAQDPLEVQLAFQVRACGTCSFFWPEDLKQRTYGPYTAFDFDVNVPYAASAGYNGASRWVQGRTRPPAFPNGEVIDGCRKAPIMTIGINPNLTAFLPGQTGAAWCYPDFSSDDDTSAWAKYAWYYRYRSVYQEKLDLDFVRRFMLPEGQVVAPRGGVVTAATRVDASAAWTITVRYDGDAADTVVAVPGKRGEFPYVLLFDPYPPRNRFEKGDVLVAQVSVPEGIQVEVLQQPQGYYMQFVPVLDQFEGVLRHAGHPTASLRVGEDVCQLDMVACASPHWNAGFLGGSPASIATIVDNCVSRNAWAIKQMVQTRPAVLYVVSQSSWNMFYSAFGAHVKRDPPISTHPVDKDFTLLRETTDPEHPAYIDFDVTIDGQRYQSRTRLVITPHFSYNSNFLSQYRLSPGDWAAFAQAQPACVAALVPANGFTVTPPDPRYPDDYVAIQLPANADAAAAARVWLAHRYPDAYRTLAPYYVEPHAQMASVLADLYAHGELAWQDTATGGYLGRTQGSCQFCVNRHWQFPNECRYGKNRETPPPAGWLAKVADSIVRTGKPEVPFAAAALRPDGPAAVYESGEPR